MPVRVLLTGGHGFLGSHLRAAAARDPRVTLEVLPRHGLTQPSDLLASVERAQVVVHLAGLNRASDEDILAVNAELVDRIRVACEASATPTHLLFASSTHRSRDDAYGRSKRAGETALLSAAESGSFALTILEMSNVFGPGCRPFYNSVVATFAHQVATGQPPTIDVDREMDLLWVDDVARGIVDICASPAPESPERWVPKGDAISVSRLLHVLNDQWKQHIQQRVVPAVGSRLEGNLYRTLISYTPDGSHAYRPPVNFDARGSLFEATRQAWAGGQSFVSTSKPGVVRGQHYHTRKMEKFCVIQGDGVVRLRRLHSEDILEYHVSGAHPTVVDIPVFFVHNLENVGSDDMLTLIWASEVFDPADPDTIPEDV
jgi:UDP-2-acetamido-2,6-beta-L-arabino-hexul-4-ose reductase